MLKRKKIFYGWWLVLASAILYFFTGGAFYYGFTIFFNPIRNSFGWTAAATSVAFSFRTLETGVMGPLAGFLVDRMSSRKLMLIGWAIAGLGFLWMGRLNSLWEFYASFLLTAIGFSLGSAIVLLAVLSRWFVKKRSRAMTLASMGAGISGAGAPLLAWLANQFGWRDSLALVGIVMLVIAIPLCLLFRNKPEPYGYLPDGEEATAMMNEPGSTPDHRSSAESAEPASGYPEEGFTAMAALKTRAFWLLAIAFLFQQIGMSTVLVHIVASLESVNISTSTAANVVMGLTVVSTIGRLIFGFLGDFTNKRYLIAITFALQTAGLLIFSLIGADRTWLIILFLIVYAPGYGGPLPLRPALQADYFGTRSYGTITGWFSLITMLSGIVSPIVAGWLFDTTGSYQMAWQIFAVISLPAIPLILLAKPPGSQTKKHLT